MNTLGELEGLTATATLRPPGAVPPPPRGLPMSAPSLDAAASPLDTPLPGGDQPFTALAGDLPPSPKTPRPYVSAGRTGAALPGMAAAAAAAAAAASATASAGAADAEEERALDSTLDMNTSASKKQAQAALVEQSRAAAPVPAPGLFIADEPLEPRPQQQSLVSVRRELLTRMRVVLLLLGGLLLMLAGALVVLIFRRSEATTARSATAPSASSAPLPPGCRLALPPSRISATIERSVPISALGLADGTIALAIADTKSSAAGWIYDPSLGEPTRKLEQPGGSGDVSHVVATDPLLATRASAELSFAQTLTPGLVLGVGPAGIMRRGEDGASGVVWPIATGVRVTPPRALAREGGYFVAFRQGGAEGQLMTGFLAADGSAKTELFALSGTPASVGTPNVAAGIGARESWTLFPARASKTEPYRVYAARSAFGAAPEAPQPLELPAEGGGAIAPSLATLGAQHSGTQDPSYYLLQWTDGGVGQYQVHAQVLDQKLKPLGEPLRVSAKGANAGQGTLVVTRSAAVSFFIQTTAGHDELWGASLSCR